MTISELLSKRFNLSPQQLQSYAEDFPKILHEEILESKEIRIPTMNPNVKLKALHMVTETSSYAFYVKRKKLAAYGTVPKKYRKNTEKNTEKDTKNAVIKSFHLTEGIYVRV